MTDNHNNETTDDTTAEECYDPLVPFRHALLDAHCALVEAELALDACKAAEKLAEKRFVAAKAEFSLGAPYTRWRLAEVARLDVWRADIHERAADASPASGDLAVACLIGLVAAEAWLDEVGRLLG